MDPWQAEVVYAAIARPFGYRFPRLSKAINYACFMNENVTIEELRMLASLVADRRGWDFSSLNVERDPVPWEYEEVVCALLLPEHRVLDIGTGGGEVFLRLAPSLGEGVGVDIDPEMIRVARQNTPIAMRDTLRFLTMSAEELRFPDASFDAIINRQAPFVATEVARLLRPSGVFVTQEVGDHNTQNIFDALGWDSNGAYMRALLAEQDKPPTGALENVAADLKRAGLTIVRRESYDVPYYFQDLDSLVFWLRAVPVPMNFDDDQNVRAIATFITENQTSRGIRTNEHRELLVAAKPVG